MPITLAYLGPEGTYSQLAALTYSMSLEAQTNQAVQLMTLPSIPQAIQATADGIADVTIVPVENSTEGAVSTTLDTLWRLQILTIDQAIVMPIRHGLLSQATDLASVSTVYSHPQALSQCQLWLEHHLPEASLVATRSTTDALSHLSDNDTVAVIASQWAAQLYDLPVLAHNINDHSDNCTKFWVLKRPRPTATPSHGQYMSLAFSLPVNGPGALLKPLEAFARQGINLSRIESRPTKRSLGEYLFFVDLEIDGNSLAGQTALGELVSCTETLINFGTYDLVTADPSQVSAKSKIQTP